MNFCDKDVITQTLFGEILTFLKLDTKYKIKNEYRKIKYPTL